MNKFSPLFRTNKVYILTPDPSNPHDIIDEFLVELNQKISVLHRFLDIYSIPYEDITSIPTTTGKGKIIVPTASITYENPSDMFSSFKGLVIPDDYNNICFTDNDVALNNIILRIESMRKSPQPPSTLLAKTYGLLRLSK